MIDNVILTYNDIELYQSEIDILCNEYISTLHDENMIYKSTVFSGMLNYIYLNKLKYIIPDTYKNDYSLLDSIFDNVYINLCTRFNICPSIIQFSVLCHIDNTFLSELRSGTYKDGSRVNPDATQTAKKWYAVCESMLLSKATNESSIGSIFALKANYGYRDNDAPQLIQVTSATQNSPEQIAEKYRDIQKPILPDLEN